MPRSWGRLASLLRSPSVHTICPRHGHATQQKRVSTPLAMLDRDPYPFRPGIDWWPNVRRFLHETAREATQQRGASGEDWRASWLQLTKLRRGRQTAARCSAPSRYGVASWTGASTCGPRRLRGQVLQVASSMTFRESSVRINGCPWRRPEELNASDHADFVQLVQTWERMMLAKHPSDR